MKLEGNSKLMNAFARLRGYPGLQYYINRKDPMHDQMMSWEFAEAAIDAKRVVEFLLDKGIVTIEQLP